MAKAAGPSKAVTQETVRVSERNARNLTLFGIACAVALLPLLLLQAGLPLEIAGSVAILMVLASLPMVWRSGRVALIAEPQRLVIGNFNATHTIPWQCIAFFAVAPAGQYGERRQLAVVLTDGKIIRVRATLVKPKDLGHVLDLCRPVAEVHGVPWGQLPRRNNRSARRVQSPSQPAGWYPDPDTQAEWRWWDGRQWGVRSSAYSGMLPGQSEPWVQGS
jgi:hypothetical protein